MCVGDVGMRVSGVGVCVSVSSPVCQWPAPSLESVHRLCAVRASVWTARTAGVHTGAGAGAVLAGLAGQGRPQLVDFGLFLGQLPLPAAVLVLHGCLQAVQHGLLRQTPPVTPRTHAHGNV